MQHSQHLALKNLHSSSSWTKISAAFLARNCLKQISTQSPAVLLRAGHLLLRFQWTVLFCRGRFSAGYWLTHTLCAWPGRYKRQPLFTCSGHMHRSHQHAGVCQSCLPYPRKRMVVGDETGSVPDNQAGCFYVSAHRQGTSQRFPQYFELTVLASVTCCTTHA